jgi:hypothetical protein
VITVTIVAAGLLVLWRLHLLTQFVGNDLWFQLTTFVLALLAIIFACIQFWDSRQHSDKMELVARSMSTRYLGIFPKEMNEIIDLIHLADKDLLIVSDFVDYGGYSSPETYQLLFEAVLRARARGVSVRWLVYAEEPAKQTLLCQFTQEDFASVVKDPKFDNYFSYWPGINKPRDYAEFCAILYRKENDFADDLRDKGVEIRTLPEKVWLYFFMQDRQDAVFLFEDIGADNRGLAFRTRDAKLVETFFGIFSRYWDNAPNRPQHRTPEPVAGVTPTKA